MKREYRIGLDKEFATLFIRAMSGIVLLMYWTMQSEAFAQARSLRLQLIGIGVAIFTFGFAFPHEYLERFVVARDGILARSFLGSSGLFRFSELQKVIFDQTFGIRLIGKDGEARSFSCHVNARCLGACIREFGGTGIEIEGTTTRWFETRAHLEVGFSLRFALQALGAAVVASPFALILISQRSQKGGLAIFAIGLLAWGLTSLCIFLFARNKHGRDFGEKGSIHP